MVLSDSIWQECIYTVISTGAYIVCYRGVPIDHCTHVTGTVSQYTSESEYNSSCILVMDLADFILINNDFTNKDPDVVP